MKVNGLLQALATNLHLVLRLWMSGSITLLPNITSWHVLGQNLSPFYLYVSLYMLVCMVISF